MVVYKARFNLNTVHYTSQQLDQPIGHKDPYQNRYRDKLRYV